MRPNQQDLVEQHLPASVITLGIKHTNETMKVQSVKDSLGPHMSWKATDSRNGFKNGFIYELTVMRLW